MRTRPPLVDLIVLPIVLGLAAALWMWHARAWDLGGRSSFLTYDSAQIAVAARELAFRGELRTLFALPADLPRHPQPPWPAAGISPGLVLLQALVFRLVPAEAAYARSDTRAALTLVLPFVAYLFLAAALALGVRHLFERWRPETPPWQRLGASMTLALVFLLDPEAQHFAMGAHTELPWLTGLVLATLGLALGVAAESPFAYGILLGVAALFRVQMVVLAPLFALLAGWCARASAPTQATGRSTSGRARRALAWSFGGFSLIVLPVWWREALVLGSPFGDLARHLLWDGPEGRAWFATFHRAATPELPPAPALAAMLLTKVAHTLPALVRTFAVGPRLFELLALLVMLGARTLPRPLKAAALAVAFVFGVGLAASALAVPWFPTLFPARMLLELAGLLAAWVLIGRLPARGLGSRPRAALWITVAVVALGWGVWQTRGGVAEVRQAALDRGTPSSLALRELGVKLNPRLERGEVVMSNLGPVLAWYSAHPVVHLTDTPEGVEGVRRFLDLGHVLLVFRDDERGWSHWREVIERPGAALVEPSLHVLEEERWRTSDDFVVVWLRLKPRGPGLAAREPDAARAAAPSGS